MVNGQQAKVGRRVSGSIGQSHIAADHTSKSKKKAKKIIGSKSTRSAQPNPTGFGSARKLARYLAFRNELARVLGLACGLHAVSAWGDNSGLARVAGLAWARVQVSSFLFFSPSLSHCQGEPVGQWL